MNLKTNIGIIFILITGFVYSQEIQGKVIDKSTGEPVFLTTVSIPEIHFRTTTDEDGKFYFGDLPNASLELVFEMIDYERKMIRMNPIGNEEVLVEMKPKHTVFEEVIVSASEGKLQNENITSIEYRSKENLFETGATTLGEALVNIPGVQQNTIGVGISRPVIRGLTGMRVVTFWDGLRIENQQWGEDHGMATSEAGMKGVEVIKGPSSLLYGADAIGGVIYYHDEPFVAPNESEFEFSTRGESNSMGSTSEFGYRTNNGKLKFNAHGNFMSHTDFMLPDGNFIVNSRFWAGNAKFAVGFRKDNYLFKARYHGSYSRLGIPGHTHDLDPDIDQFIDHRRGLRSPILPVQHIFNNMLLIENKFLFENSDLTIHTGYTRNHLREFDHNPDIPFTNMILHNGFYNIKYNWDISDRINLKTGVQGMTVFNRNDRFTEEFLVPDANSIDGGVYSVLSYNLNKWRFQVGGRYDFRTLESFESPEEFAINISADPINRTYQTANFSSGLMRKGDVMISRFNISSGYRAPHYSELLADGVHHGSLRYEKGDRNLVPEQAIQFDLSFEWGFDHLELFINPYISLINNYIFLQATDSLVSAPSGNYSYFEFQQVDRAMLYGGEVGFHYHPHKLHRLHLYSDFSLTIGEDQSENPINLIPQPNLNSRVRFDIDNKHKFKVNYISLEHQFFMDQYRVAEFERPTDAYHLVNLAVKMSYLETFGLQVGVRNLLNTEFVAHMSPLKNLGPGIPQPGINMFVKLSVNL